MRLLQRACGSCHYWLTAPSVAWQRRTAAYLVVVVGFAMCLGLIDRNGDQDRRRDALSIQAQLDRDCIARKDGRDVLRAVVMTADAARTVDYRAIPSFANLDPATQQFLLDLADASNARRGGESFVDQALRKIPPIECPEPPGLRSG